MEPHTHLPLLCHRCGAQLTPGEGNFYVVRIVAVADPSPPIITEGDLEVDFDEAISRIIDELRDVPLQELMDQVYRRMTIHLCARCYAGWIEDPAR